MGLYDAFAVKPYMLCHRPVQNLEEAGMGSLCWGLCKPVSGELERREEFAMGALMCAGDVFSN